MTVLRIHTFKTLTRDSFYIAMDMAIGLVLFNPVRTKRIIMNYLYTVNEFKRHRFPVFTLELCFGNSSPEISDSFVVRGNSHMFHKEKLCRILETKIPEVYTKIVFIDADILFDSSDWYKRTSDLLETHDAVHPFETCKWLDLTYTKVLFARETIMKMKTPYWSWEYHPGFAWAFRREWYRKVGFYDLVIQGSGDTWSVGAWLKRTKNDGFIVVSPTFEKSYSEYCKHPPPRVTYLPRVSIFHMYHGSRNNRQYGSRDFLIPKDPDIQNVLYENQDGVFEWRSPLEWNGKYIEYFKGRFDDDVS